MLLTLGASGQKVVLKKQPFTPEENFLQNLNAKLEICFISGVFQKENLQFASAKGKIEAAIKTNCFKCGEEVRVNLEIDFDEEFHSDENEDFYVLNGSQIDLSQMIIDKILLNFPANILCKKDCKGLCAKCGANLNKEKCECDNELDLSDPANPFSILKKLKF